MGRLDGKVAVITGGGSGNGRGMARRFAEEGAAVAIGDVDETGLDETAEMVTVAGGEVLAIRCDVTRKADVDQLVEAAIERFGRLDIVVANAGVTNRDTDCFVMTEAEFDRTIAVNVKGVFLTLQAGANALRRQRQGGRLIAISSIMGEWGSAGAPAYCASKGAVKQLVKSVAIACGPLGITCNAIGPGFIETPMTANSRETAAMDAFIRDRTPYGDMGRPEDVAAVAVFLASDEARYLNGTTIFPDGGITAGLYSGQMAAAMAAQRGQRG